MRQQFLIDTADVFKAYVFENNRKAVPSTATLTVYNPGTTTKLITDAAMTVAADGLLSYSLTDAHNATADENYKAVVSYTLSGTVYNTTLFYDIVNAKLHQVITDEDLFSELPQLKDKGEVVHGTAENGSTMTIVDTELSRYEDDYFTGGLATNLTNSETREIAGFVSSTGTVTFAAATATAAGHKYMLQRSFSKEIRRAFEKIDDLLTRAGNRPHLILDPYDLREVHILFSVAEVCKGFATDENSFWWTLWKDYDSRSFAVFKSLNLKYDESDDGTLGSGEEGKRMTRRIGRA